MEEDKQFEIINKQLQEIQSRIKTTNDNLNTLDEKKTNIIAGIEKRTKKGIQKWLLYWIGGGVLSLIVLAWGVYNTVMDFSKQYLTNSIKEQFSRPNIQKTLQDVASKQAKSIITEQIIPEEKKVKDNIASFQNYLDTMKGKYDAGYTKLAKQLEDEISDIKELDNINELDSEALAGSLLAYRKLINISYQNSKYSSIAKDKIRSIKKQFIDLQSPPFTFEQKGKYSINGTNLEDCSVYQLIFSLNNQDDSFDMLSTTIRILINKLNVKTNKTDLSTLLDFMKSTDSLPGAIGGSILIKQLFLNQLKTSDIFDFDFFIDFLNLKISSLTNASP